MEQCKTEQTARPAGPDTHISTEQSNTWAKLLAAQRYQELSRQLDVAHLDQPSIADDLLFWRYRGELAVRGHAPLADGIIAARKLIIAEDPAAVELVAGAVRRAAGIKAFGNAEQLLDEARARWTKHEPLQLAQEQLALARKTERREAIEGSRREQVLIAQQLAAGSIEKARQQLVQLLDTATLTIEQKQWVLQRLIEIEQRASEHRDVAEHLAQLCELAPENDHAELQRMARALHLWTAGERDEAQLLLKQLREATHEADAAEGQYVHRVVSEVLEALDHALDKGGPGASWQRLDLSSPAVPFRCTSPGAALFHCTMTMLGQGSDQQGADHLPPSQDVNSAEHNEASCRSLPSLPDDLPTMAHIRYWLTAAGKPTARLLLDEEKLVTALAHQALVIIEEERSIETGFLIVLGYEPNARLLLLLDPQQLAPRIRGLEDQRRRNELFGQSALLVFTDQTQEQRLREAGLAHDPRMDHVDCCDIDEQGRPLPKARLVTLTKEAIEALPALPSLHRRQGEALLEQLRMGHLEPAPAGPFEQWLAATRLRFPDAEWPFQIYAQALELQERWEEAGIAWTDAMERDPYDVRNLLGQARVLFGWSRYQSADQLLSRALCLQPECLEAHIQRAKIALAEEHLTLARTEADLAAEISPYDPDALLIKASVVERTGELEEARQLLQRVTQSNSEHGLARLRLLRHYVHLGQWNEADRLANELCSLAPGGPLSWETAARVAWGTGDGQRAFSLALTGLQRCGPTEALLAMAVQVLTSLFADEEAQQALASLMHLLASSPPALRELATMLGEKKWYPEARAVAEQAYQLFPQDANTAWRLARILLASPAASLEHAARIDQLLQETIERAKSFPYPRVVFAWRQLERDPASALALLSEADPEIAPGPVWYLQACALERSDRTAEAARIWERLPEIFPHGVLESIDLLRSVGLGAVCVDLLQRVLRVMPDEHEVKLELARTRGHLGDDQAELEIYLDVEAQHRQAVNPLLMIAAAERCRRWEIVERLAWAIIDEIQRNSNRGIETWSTRGQLAGARLAQGDPAPRADLFARAPSHPGALAALVRIERMLGDDHAEEDSQRLQQIAPGTYRILQAKEQRHADHH